VLNAITRTTKLLRFVVVILLVQLPSYSRPPIILGKEKKHYAMKAYGGEFAYIHVFLTSALVGGEWSVSTPCHLTLRKGPRYPLDKLGGPQSRSGRYEEVKILDSTGTQNPTVQSSSPYAVAVPTTLPRLRLSWVGDKLISPDNQNLLMISESKLKLACELGFVKQHIHLSVF
jgi:hypothetical protein